MIILLPIFQVGYHLLEHLQKLLIIEAGVDIDAFAQVCHHILLVEINHPRPLAALQLGELISMKNLRGGVLELVFDVRLQQAFVGSNHGTKKPNVFTARTPPGIDTFIVKVNIFVRSVTIGVKTELHFLLGMHELLSRQRMARPPPTIWTWESLVLVIKHWI